MNGAEVGIIFRAGAGRELIFTVLGARLAAGLVLLLSSKMSPALGIAWLVVAAGNILIDTRFLFAGSDGSDQMVTIVSVTLAVSSVLGSDSQLLGAGLFFIGAQACLAYSAAGVAKLISPAWRNGDAIRGVLSTRAYGVAAVTVFVQKSPMLALSLCWGVIAFEVTFILAPILPLPVLAALLGTAALFHLCCAVVMGLNGFFWSFLSAYPAVIFLNRAVTGLLL
ncbi:hypothetical protein ACFWVP_23935 [Streptomyces sp. NPDC058637]|uniref:hypothetical protein n=1 Tax=Streptomyces sp. NPDC058637 TaxID=3346569 RepID=UPI003657403D